MAIVNHACRNLPSNYNPKLYGPNRMVANPIAKQKDRPQQYRCVFCGMILN